MTVQPGLCRTWSETQIVGFLMHRLIFLSGGVLEATDFTMDYKARVESAMEFKFGNYSMFTQGGNSGGPVVGLIINILKGMCAATIK